MTQENQATAKGKKPTHRLYVIDGEGDKANWIAVGAAWANKDGKGFSIELSALPLNGGRLVLREIQTKEETEAA
jgi:hypothetical protein